MARLAIEGHQLVVRLSLLEQLGAIKVFEPQVPLAAIRRIRWTQGPWEELVGIRAPGTGIPRVIMLGTVRYRGGCDFCAIYGRRPAVVVELDGTPYRRLLVSSTDAPRVADHLNQVASHSPECGG